MARFLAGRSGNPGGRPKGRGEAARIARRYTADAVFALARVACDVSASPALQRRAALDLIRLGYGVSSKMLDETASAASRGRGRWPGLAVNLAHLLRQHEREEGQTVE